MRLEYREDPREWRRLTLATLVGPAVLASFCWWQGWIGFPVWLAVVTMLIPVGMVAVFRPTWFRGYYRGIVWFGYQVARGLGYAILTGIFWLCVVPMGLVLRGTGRDLLQLRRDHTAVTYWRKAPPPTSLDRMF